MLPISVCRFARRRSCPGVSPQRFDSLWHALVAASCISLASVQARKLVHSAAAPLPTKSSILREPCCRSWHTSPGDHIPAGRLFSCQGARPPTCMEWEGRFARVFFGSFYFPLHLFGLGSPLWGVFLKDFFTLPLVRTEIPVFFGCFE